MISVGNLGGAPLPAQGKVRQAQSSTSFSALLADGTVSAGPRAFGFAETGLFGVKRPEADGKGHASARLASFAEAPTPEIASESDHVRPAQLGVAGGGMARNATGTNPQFSGTPVRASSGNKGSTSAAQFCLEVMDSPNPLPERVFPISSALRAPPPGRHLHFAARRKWATLRLDESEMGLAIIIRDSEEDSVCIADIYADLTAVSNDYGVTFKRLSFNGFEFNFDDSVQERR